MVMVGVLKLEADREPCEANNTVNEDDKKELLNV